MMALLFLGAMLVAGCLAGAGLSALLAKRQIAHVKAELQTELLSETSSLREAFDKLADPKIPTVPLNAFNLNRRPEAVRRLRAGQALDAIATGTGWTVPEIALLEKIEKLDMTPGSQVHSSLGNPRFGS